MGGGGEERGVGTEAGEEGESQGDGESGRWSVSERGRSLQGLEGTVAACTSFDPTQGRPTVFGNALCSL